ncbi:cytochrome c oxidase subunit 3 family protein [Nocardia sp. NPDC051750]|uniref:cytochrome c oxidase subunit 3 family protein n=1 Tax=Nocardia sp. NPDC051750 TaxID=3364325 RepID=UPI0037A70529
MTDTDRSLSAASEETRESRPAVTERLPLPGDGHMWVMVLGDLLIFGAYFVIFMVHRAMAPQEFLAAQQHLNIDLGTVNTLVLLTSSWCVARSVQTSRAGSTERALRLIYAGAGLGALFIGIKIYEWSAEVAGGYTLAAGEFFTFYYMLTGVHLFHVALGLLILGIVVRELRDPHRRRIAVAESGAVYWHMVDLLWIVIFGLLYVMR